MNLLEIDESILIISRINNSVNPFLAPGFANIDDGVLIDLSKLTTLQHDVGENAVTVGSGNRWREVYTYLEPYGDGGWGEGSGCWSGWISPRL
jgi:FAD/FMN-containing dehydrogenase